jgi:replicative DNA helicase
LGSPLEEVRGLRLCAASRCPFSSSRYGGTATGAIETINAPTVRTDGEERQEHERRLEQYRGYELIGLKTGQQKLDDRTCGLRGLIFLAAPPVVGKTALVMAWSIGICRHHTENDAVVVFLSLDMDRWEIFDRIHCNLSGMEWATLKFGSSDLVRAAPGSLV